MTDPVPLTIGRTDESPDSEVVEIADAGEALGHAVAGMLRHLLAVLDREDRLEAGTGDLLADLAADESRQVAAVRAGVLRSLRMALTPIGFSILEALDHVNGRTLSQLASATGEDQLAIAQIVSDLVSAGLAVKLPEAGQISGTPAGSSLVGLVRTATTVGAADLRSAP